MKKIVNVLAAVIGLGFSSFAFAGGGDAQPVVASQPAASDYVSREYVNQLSLDFIKAQLKKRFVDVDEIEEWALRSVYFLVSNNCVTIVGDRIAGQDFNVPQAPKTTIRGAQSDKAARPEMFKLLAELASNILFGKCSAGAFSNIDQLKASQDILKITDKNLGDELTKLKAQLEALKNRPDGDQVARDALSKLQNDYISLANLRFEIAGNYDKLNVRILSLGEELALQRREIDELKARKPLKGDAGQAGSQGTSGPAGTPGQKGEKGDTGAQGPKGDTGPAGANGTNGAGSTGPQGPAGTPGQTGAQGPKGDKGDTGVAGANGTNGAGSTGPQGTAGVSGQKGDKGDPGTAGVNGTNGATGPAGKDGRDGSNGRDGKDGQTVTAAAPAAAPITNTNTNTATANVVVNVYGGVATTAPDGKTVDVRMPAAPVAVAPSVNLIAAPTLLVDCSQAKVATRSSTGVILFVCTKQGQICFYLVDGSDASYTSGVFMGRVGAAVLTGSKGQYGFIYRITIADKGDVTIQVTQGGAVYLNQ
jgi:hypothetical protein